ncbi:hypothetical protein [Paenibacillus aquistagni]|uniref:hypothetical protein n=1 Tax=Paenibacillus aquistagni TaxID=1852522 RepID=UPI000B501C3B|nr:hypothetical protein [Paenibacillus aquistagni]
MTIVNVIDAPCGFGKTSWAIQYMNEMSIQSHSFIYVTPFLDEVTRVQKSVLSREFHEPKSIKGDTKLEDLHRLLGEGKDIATTHALFKMANSETRDLIRSNNYTLILDEVMNVIEQVPLKKDDLESMEELELIEYEVNDRGLTYIRWKQERLDHESQFDIFKKYAVGNNLMLCADKTALIWNLPCDIFKLFSDVFIMTYLFKGQFQRYYYDLHGIKYRYLSVAKNDQEYKLVPYIDREVHDKERLRSLITVYEGKLNDIGDNRNKLSKGWLENIRNKDLIITLKRHTFNFLTNYCKANNSTALWTTVKGNNEKIQKKLTPKGYKNSFIPMTERATNLHKDKYHLAYLVNRFMNPIEKGFFQQYNVQVDEDTWALSELIQWIWRSSIRDGKPIVIYIPSKRMRDLFKQYLTSDKFETLPEEVVIDQPPSDWNL